MGSKGIAALRGRFAILVALLMVVLALSACDEGADITALAIEANSQIKLYGADGAQGNLSTLYELDRTTGAMVRAVGPIGFAVTGLAAHPITRVVYGVTGAQDPAFPGHLIMVDRVTGAGTVIGQEIGGATNGAADITFTTDGTLYGWSEATDDLVTIDLATGAATVVGESAMGTAGSGIAALYPSNVLYFAGFDDCGNLTTVDRATGLVTPVATMTGTCFRINAMAFDLVGTLYGVRNLNGIPAASELIRIDTATGALTTLGPSVNRLDAIAFF